MEQATKSREREMKEAKEAERNLRVQAIKDRRKAKEEKERYEKMAEKMHAKLWRGGDGGRKGISC